MRRVLLALLLTVTAAFPAAAQGIKILNFGSCNIASTTASGCVVIDGSSIHINAQGVISAPTAGGGNVSGPGSSTSGFLPTWSNTAGTGLAAGLPVGTTGNSTVIQTTSGGLLTPSILPLATSGAFGAVKVDGTTITAAAGVISLASTISQAMTFSGQVNFSSSSSMTIAANPVNFTGTAELNGTPFAPIATSGSASDLSTGTLLGARLGSFSGDVTTSGGTYVLTLQNVNSTPGSYNCGGTFSLTVNAKGLMTAGQTGTCAGGGGPGGPGDSIALDATHSLALDATHALRMQ